MSNIIKVTDNMPIARGAKVAVYARAAGGYIWIAVVTEDRTPEQNDWHLFVQGNETDINSSRFKDTIETAGKRLYVNSKIKAAREAREREERQKQEAAKETANA